MSYTSPSQHRLYQVRRGGVASNKCTFWTHSSLTSTQAELSPFASKDSTLTSYRSLPQLEAAEQQRITDAGNASRIKS